MKLNVPSVPLAIEVALSPQLSYSAKVLHALMCGWDTDNDSILEMEQAEIAQRLNVSARTVYTTIKELETVGLISVNRHRRAVNTMTLHPISESLLHGSPRFQAHDYRSRKAA